jgi:hypothetical protein
VQNGDIASSGFGDSQYKSPFDTCPSTMSALSLTNLQVGVGGQNVLISTLNMTYQNFLQQVNLSDQLTSSDFGVSTGLISQGYWEASKWYFVNVERGNIADKLQPRNLNVSFTNNSNVPINAFESSRLIALACNGGIFRVVFFGIGSTLIDAHTLSGQTEGLRVGGGMGANIYYCLPPAGGRIRSQGNKMRRLRRRNHEWAEEWIGWLSRFKLIRLRRNSLATLRMDGRRDGRKGGCGFSSLVKKQKGEKLRCILLRRKKIIFYIYDLITWGKKIKKLC